MHIRFLLFSQTYILHWVILKYATGEVLVCFEIPSGSSGRYVSTSTVSFSSSRHSRLHKMLPIHDLNSYLPICIYSLAKSLITILCSMFIRDLRSFLCNMSPGFYLSRLYHFTMVHLICSKINSSFQWYLTVDSLDLLFNHVFIANTIYFISILWTSSETYAICLATGCSYFYMYNSRSYEIGEGRFILFYYCERNSLFWFSVFLSAG